jgi:DnaJ domain
MKIEDFEVPIVILAVIIAVVVCAAVAAKGETDGERFVGLIYGAITFVLLIVIYAKTRDHLNIKKKDATQEKFKESTYKQPHENPKAQQGFKGYDDVGYEEEEEEPEDSDYAFEDDEELSAKYMKILGLKEGFTLEDLKQAYRRESKKYHPDIYANHDEDFREMANDKMKLMNEAKDYLEEMLG